MAKGFEAVLIDEAGRGDRTTFESGDEVEFACCIFSPGFAADHPWRALAESSSIPCLSEIAFAATHWQGRIVGITGTNGKTTLTALLDNALRHAGYTSVAAGNIGYPFSDAVLSDSNQTKAFAVVEISSFQAELADGLELDAFLWTNFAEDHLDRYASMARYFSAKARLFDCLKKEGICVVSPQVANWMAAMGKDFNACTVAYRDPLLARQLSPDSVFRHYPYSENYSLAAELWWLMDERSSALVEAATTSVLAPHRLQVVAELGGVRYWNDSKATNFHATLAALSSVDRPIVWIGGGRTKGGDVEAFAQEVAGHVEAAVVYGEVADRLAGALSGSLDSIHVYHRFADAVLAAAALAAAIPDANVLLSPAFSSLDQFDSYEARGKSFMEMVLSLKSARKLR